MKKYLLVALVAVFFELPLDSVHADSRIRQPDKERKKQALIDAAAEEIPLYTDRIKDRAYEIIGTVDGWDVLNKGKKAVYLQMRRQALKLKADAIADVSCETTLKAVAQSCHGFAIKWK